MLIGWLIERNDKRKREQEQQQITDVARRSMFYNRYEEKHEESCGWSLVKLVDDRYAYVDKNGRYLNDEIFVAADDFENGVAAIRLYDKGVSLIDKYGHYLIPFEEGDFSTSIEKLYPGLYAYHKHITHKRDYIDQEEYYIYNSFGKCINDQCFTEIIEVRDNYIKAKKNDMIQAIDFQGNYLVDAFYKKVDLGHGLFRVNKKKYGDWGIYDEHLDMIIIPCKYDGILYIEPYDLFVIEQDSEVQLVDRGNRVIIPPKYDYIELIDNQYIRAVISAKDDSTYKFFILNPAGNVILQSNGGEIWPSKKGYMVTESLGHKKCCFVKIDGSYDIEYDSYEPLYIDSLYDEYSSHDVGRGYFVSHDTIKEREKECSVIRRANYRTSDMPFEKVYQRRPKYFIVRQGNKRGIVNLENDEIVPIRTQFIKVFPESGIDPLFCIVGRCSIPPRYGIYLLDGRNTIPMIYKKITPKYALEWYLEIETFEGEHIQMDIYGEPFLREKVIAELVKETWEIFKTHESVVSSKQIHDNKYKESPTCCPTNTCSHISTLVYYLFFDTETVGLPKDFNAPSSDTTNWPRLVQLSWILTDDKGNRLHTGDYIVKPDGFTIPTQASKLHGITTQRAKDEGYDLEDVLCAFKMDLKKATTLVGHNIDFDKKIVGTELIRIGEKDIIKDMPSICTMKKSTEYCAIPCNKGYKYPTLQELYEKLFGYKFADNHNSLSDIISTEKCFWKMKEIGLIK